LCSNVTDKYKWLQRGNVGAKVNRGVGRLLTPAEITDSYQE
jgi:hypothetical protein